MCQSLISIFELVESYEWFAFHETDTQMNICAPIKHMTRKDTKKDRDKESERNKDK